MKSITQATEERIKSMVKRDHKYGDLLKTMLDTMKGDLGWLGASIKEMKDAGLEIESRNEVNALESNMNEIIGLSNLFPENLSCGFIFDVHCAGFKDFNRLVKDVDNLENNGWGIC